MKALVVTTVHDPLDARIHHRQVRALLQADVEVTYAAPWRATGTPLSEVAAGARAVDLPRASGRRRLRSLLAARRTIARLGREHDVVLLHDPELLLAVLGRLRRLPPVVLDVHEDLPASVADRRWIPRGLRRPAVRLANWLERRAERALAGLLLAETAYAERFDDDHPVVANLPWMPTALSPAAQHQRVVYVGRLSTGRGVHDLVDLAERLDRDGDPRVELIGPADRDVVDAVEAAVHRGTLDWHGRLPNDVALARVEGTVAGLSPLHDLPNYRSSMPTKIVEYLAHQVPAITTPLPEARRLIEATGAGYVVPFEDVDALVEAVRSLAADPETCRRLGAAGHAYVAEGHSWDAVAPAFVEYLRDLAGDAASGAFGGGSATLADRPPGHSSGGRP